MARKKKKARRQHLLTEKDFYSLEKRAARALAKNRQRINRTRNGTPAGGWETRNGRWVEKNLPTT